MVDTKKKVYLFKVTLDEYPGKDEGDEEEVFSEMALKGTTSLHKFAKTIMGAFQLDMDTSFCFFSKIYNGRTLEYTNMADTEPISTTHQHERSVKNSYIHEMFEPGKELFFHCDFEHNNTYSWEFLVNCCSITEAEVGETYPKVLYVVK